MWNWNLGKSFVFGVLIGGLLLLAGLNIKAVTVITIGFSVFIHWLVDEINQIRESHGSNLEKLETEIEELKDRLETLEKNK